MVDLIFGIEIFLPVNDLCKFGVYSVRGIFVNIKRLWLSGAESEMARWKVLFAIFFVGRKNWIAFQERVRIATVNKSFCQQRRFDLFTFSLGVSYQMSKGEIDLREEEACSRVLFSLSIFFVQKDNRSWLNYVRTGMESFLRQVVISSIFIKKRTEAF